MTNLLIDVVIVALAAWRVSSLLVHEDGPLEVFERFREWVGVENEGRMNVWQKLLTCVWCTSSYVVPPIWLLWIVFPPVVLWLAAWAVVVAIEVAVRGR